MLDLFKRIVAFLFGARDTLPKAKDIIADTQRASTAKTQAELDAQLVEERAETKVASDDLDAAIAEARRINAARKP